MTVHIEHSGRDLACPKSGAACPAYDTRERKWPHLDTFPRGRPPFGLERMLRLYCLQHWHNLSGPALEEALYGTEAMGRFVGY